MPDAPASLAPPAPEVLLRKATLAKTAGLRARYAQRGLAHPGAVDRTTQGMLLRQLYLSHLERGRFVDACHVAEQMVGLGVMPDVAHQDAARAHLALDELEAAVEHLRLAGRVAPPSRRAFHLWTLGSVLLLRGRAGAAASALVRAVRWGTHDRPLYEGQLALARLALGQDPGDLDDLRDRLAEAPCGQGYGELVLGELCLHTRRHREARRYLEAFITRVTRGRVATAVALRAEVTHAEQLLARCRTRNSAAPRA